MLRKGTGITDYPIKSWWDSGRCIREAGCELFSPLDEDGKNWRETVVSGEALEGEDNQASDLNGNIVAAVR